MYVLQQLRGSDAPLTAFLAFYCVRMQGEIAGGFDSLAVLLFSWGRKGKLGYV